MSNGMGWEVWVKASSGGQVWSKVSSAKVKCGSGSIEETVEAANEWVQAKLLEKSSARVSDEKLVDDNAVSHS